ncbi:MAG: hypothetical protein DKINENOH_03074 [bacterium]|nr:hypothetical protein [bacterium]
MSKCKRFYLMLATALVLLVSAAFAQWTSPPSGLPSDLGKV